MVKVPFIRKRDLRGLEKPSLSGHTAAEYRGQIAFNFFLDKGLIWKAQLKNMTNKASQAFFGPVRAHLVKPGV